MLYHGVSRRCWRRLDLLPHLSLAQRSGQASGSTITSAGAASGGYSGSGANGGGNKATAPVYASTGI